MQNKKTKEQILFEKRAFRITSMSHYGAFNQCHVNPIVYDEEIANSITEEGCSITSKLCEQLGSNSKDASL